MRHVPHRARRLVAARSRSQCERCGQRKPLQMSHRIARGMGGSLIGQDNPALYCHLCADCHSWVETYPHLALHTGFKVERGTNPATVPADLWYGPHLLDDHGGAIAWIPKSPTT